ncbi:hypothetical protein HDU98_008281 [Podochytrium sp. JEL0797]|nr:hypothetical protein HDU98_008281 [Podochytrium sp. JEL0797]
MTAYEILSQGNAPFTDTPDALLFQQVVYAGVRPEKPEGWEFVFGGTHERLWGVMGRCLGRESFGAVSGEMKVLVGVAERRIGGGGVWRWSESDARVLDERKGKRDPSPRVEMPHGRSRHRRGGDRRIRKHHSASSASSSSSISSISSAHATSSDSEEEERSNPRHHRRGKRTASPTSKELTLVNSAAPGDVELQFDKGTWGAFVYNLLPILPIEAQKDIKSKMHEFALQLHQEDVQLEGQGMFIDFIQDVKNAGAKAKAAGRDKGMGGKEGGFQFVWDWDGKGVQMRKGGEKDVGRGGKEGKSGITEILEGVNQDLNKAGNDVGKELEKVGKQIGDAAQDVRNVFYGGGSSSGEKTQPIPVSDPSTTATTSLDAEREKLRVQEEAVRIKRSEFDLKEKELHQQRMVNHKQLELQRQKLVLQQKEMELARLENPRLESDAKHRALFAQLHDGLRKMQQGEIASQERD